MSVLIVLNYTVHSSGEDGHSEDEDIASKGASKQVDHLHTFTGL